MTGVPRPPGPRNARVGANVKRTRERRQLSQRDLAVRLGGKWNQGKLSRIELGQTAILVEDLYDLCAALDVTLPTLLRQTNGAG